MFRHLSAQISLHKKHNEILRCLHHGDDNYKYRMWYIYVDTDVLMTQIVFSVIVVGDRIFQTSKQDLVNFPKKYKLPSNPILTI